MKNKIKKFASSSIGINHTLMKFSLILVVAICVVPEAIAQSIRSGCQIEWTDNNVNCLSVDDASGTVRYRVCLTLRYKTNHSNLQLQNWEITNGGSDITSSASNQPGNTLAGTSDVWTNYNFCYEISVPIGTNSISNKISYGYDAGNLCTDIIDVDLPPCYGGEGACTNCTLQTTNIRAQQSGLDKIVIEERLFSAFPMKRISAEIIYYALEDQKDGCEQCIKDLERTGSFVDRAITGSPHNDNWILNSGSISGLQTQWSSFYPVPGSLFTRQLEWYSSDPATGMNISGGARIIMFIGTEAIPPKSCCSDKISFCIRYMGVTTSNTTCTLIKCYEVNRENECSDGGVILHDGYQSGSNFQLLNR